MSVKKKLAYKKSKLYHLDFAKLYSRWCMKDFSDKRLSAKSCLSERNSGH